MSYPSVSLLACLKGHHLPVYLSGVGDYSSKWLPWLRSWALVLRMGFSYGSMNISPLASLWFQRKVERSVLSLARSLQLGWVGMTECSDQALGLKISRWLRFLKYLKHCSALLVCPAIDCRVSSAQLEIQEGNSVSWSDGKAWLDSLGSWRCDH